MLGTVQAALLGGSVKAAPLPTQIYDRFSSVTDNVSINGRTPDQDSIGTTWSVITGGVKGYGTSAVRGNASGTPNIAIIDAGVADCVISANIVYATNRGFIYRRASSSSWFVVVYSSTTALQLLEWTGAAYSVRANSTGSENVGTSITLTLAGNVHTAVSGLRTVTYTSSVSNTATNHGILLYDNTNADAIDDFKIDW